MPKLKAGLISPREAAAIDDGIAADDAARELDSEWFAKAKPASKAFKTTGKGWQTRINAALRQFVAEHPVNR